MRNVVVNVRGTSGSGKSTVAYRVIEKLAGSRQPGGDLRQMMAGKERHAGHQVGNLFLVGKYATDCGGCDSMSWKGAADDICDLIKHKAMFGPVLAEGLMLSSWGSGRLYDLSQAESVDLHALMLTTSLEECLASVRARREGAWRRKGLKGSPPPLNPENTTAKYHGSLKGAQTLEKMGVKVEYLDREAAFARALALVTSS